MVKAFSYSQLLLQHQAIRDLQKLSSILPLNRANRPILIFRQTKWHLESGSLFWAGRLCPAQGALPWQVEAETQSVPERGLPLPGGPPFSNYTDALEGLVPHSPPPPRLPSESRCRSTSAQGMVSHTFGSDSDAVTEGGVSSTHVGHSEHVKIILHTRGCHWRVFSTGVTGYVVFL